MFLISIGTSGNSVSQSFIMYNTELHKEDTEVHRDNLSLKILIYQFRVNYTDEI